MTARTRFFVISSLSVLIVGVGTGLVAYYAGFTTAFSRNDGPEELRYVPRDSAVIAYADVRDVMTSEFRRKMHESMPIPRTGSANSRTKPASTSRPTSTAWSRASRPGSRRAGLRARAWWSLADASTK